jgi:hypothetical protein
MGYSLRKKPEPSKTLRKKPEPSKMPNLKGPVETTTSSTSTVSTQDEDQLVLNDDFHSWSEENIPEVIKLWSLSEKQVASLRQFQDLIADVNHWKNEPHTAVMFLIEYRWKPKSTERHFRKMIEWRQDNNVDTILDDYCPPEDFNYYPAAILKGLDRDGDPILLERSGAAQPWSLQERYGNEEMFKEAIWKRELESRGKWIDDYQRKHKRPMTRLTVVIDLHGLSTKHIRPGILSLVAENSKTVQANWPAAAKRIIAIRAPLIFRIAWNFLKPFLNESVKEMLVFATTSDYLEVLDRYIDISVLPECINPDGMGEALDEFSPVWDGGPLPLEKKAKAPIVDMVASTTRLISKSQNGVSWETMATGSYSTTLDGRPVVTSFAPSQ